MSTALKTVREVLLGPAELVPMGEGRAFCVEGLRLAVFRERNGSAWAVEDACPHEGGPLSEGVTGTCTVVCPLHSWKFNLATGECLNDPAYRLRTHPVRQEDGRLFVTLD